MVPDQFSDRRLERFTDTELIRQSGLTEPLPYTRLTDSLSSLVVIIFVALVIVLVFVIVLLFAPFLFSPFLFSAVSSLSFHLDSSTPIHHSSRHGNIRVGENTWFIYIVQTLESDC
jgi:hypothetical protein